MALFACVSALGLDLVIRRGNPLVFDSGITTHNQHGLSASKMERYIPIFGSVAFGFLISLGLRDICPSTQRRKFRYTSCTFVLILVVLADYIDDHHVSSLDSALMFLPLGLGVVLSDLLALATMQFGAPNHPDKCIDAGLITPPHGESTPSKPQKHNDRADGIEHSSLAQRTKKDPQDQHINPENDSRGATLQQSADEKSNPGDGPETAKPEQPVVKDTQSMHAGNEWIIKSAKPNNHHHYEARALPNKRLKYALHVNNCFTEDQKRCSEFRKEVENMLQPENEKQHWHDRPELVEVASSAARSALLVSAEEVNLFDAIHLTVLKTMLKVLFGMSFEGSSKDHLILNLSRGVNEQWIESKKSVVPGEIPEWEFERQGSLKAVAEELFPEWGADNKCNPFNRILPGYEAMWRVVLRSILEIESTRHPAAASETWKERLASFVQNPTRDQLQNQKNDTGLTVEHLSLEVLRLYPPTRHVARLRQNPEGEREQVLTADIELMHHTASVWGEDPLTFRPERWTTLNGMDQTGYMPFGCAPFNCPAKKHKGVEIPFGVTIIAVLTGCFIEAMADEWRLDEQYIPSVGKPLCNGRKSYAEVSLVRLKLEATDVTSNVVDEPKKAATDTTDADQIDAERTDAEKINAEKAEAEKTETETTDADSTATDDTDINANREQADDDKTDDDKTDGEAKTELNETNDSDGEEDEKQVDAAQQ